MNRLASGVRAAAVTVLVLFTAVGASRGDDSGHEKGHSTDAAKHENRVTVTMREDGVEKDIKLNLALNSDMDDLVKYLHSGHVEKMEKDEQPNILALSWELGLWTLVVFGLLLFALKRLAWGPMLEGLQNREAGIRSALEEARKAREEAQALRDQFQKEIDASRASAQAIVADARKSADRLAEERQQKATADIQTERERLHRELDAARDQALQQIRQQAGDLAVLVSGKVLRRQLNLDDHRQLVDEALADLRRAGDERQRTVVGV